MEFSTQPGQASGGTPFAIQPVVLVLDENGARLTDRALPVSIALSQNPSGATLSGTTSVTTDNGLATFSDLEIDKAATGYVLVATVETISAESQAFDVAVGPPSGLRFSTQPGGAFDDGLPFDSQPQVEILDPGGNRVTDATTVITLILGANPSGGVLSGTTSRAATAGVVDFDDLAISRSGAGYTLVASGPRLEVANSRLFTVRRWTGQVEVAVTTTGGSLDPDGYRASLSGGPPRTIPTNGTGLLDSVPPGAHVLSVTGAAFNCSIANPTWDVVVQSGAKATVSLAASCRRYLSDEVLFDTEEFGLPVQIMAMRPDGTGRTRITNDGVVGSNQAKASPDGLTVAFVRRDATGFGIYLMNADGTNIRLLVRRSDFDGEPAWSPDGTRIAFRSVSPGPAGDYGRIWIINVDGTGLRQVSPETMEYTFDGTPSWSPDGQHILFSRSGQLYTIRENGTDLRQIGYCSSACNHPAWSPDGSRIALSMVVDGNYDLYVIDADGANLTRLTTDPVQDDNPVWSPDGKELLFARVKDDKFRIFKMSSSGGSEVQLSPSTVPDNPSHWAKPQVGRDQ